MLHLIGLTLNGIGIAKRDQVQLFDKIKGIEKEAMIYANKAVQYNIVGKEGSVYKIAGRTLGTDIEAVKSMIMSDSELFENYIKPEVDKLEESEPKEKELEIPDEIKELLPVESASRKRVARSVK
jgi:AAA+ ATPase superfamily predicted ATPase